MQQKVLVTGSGGQLGWELVRSAVSPVNCIALGRAEFNLESFECMAEALDRHAPQQVINAAAYTAVDGAETDAASAWRVNCEGPGHLARACAERGIRLLHVSTDFVFDGESAHPYRPGDAAAPLGEYGRSKLAGEQAVLDACPEAAIFRTGWLYSCRGSNFVKTMLRLMGEREVLSVVQDQVGTPTWGRGLAAALWAAVNRQDLSGIYHWSDAGVCSWYDFAVAVYEEARVLGLLEGEVSVRPIASSDYPTPARRPAFSVLDKTSSWRDLELDGIHWRQQLRGMLKEMREQKHD